MTISYFILLFYTINVIGAFENPPLSNTTNVYAVSELYGHPGDGYYLKLFIGIPPQEMAVLVDTGSSNMAVASINHPNVSRYFLTQNSSTYISLDQNVELSYSLGRWSGNLGTDIISISTLPNVTCEFVCITTSTDFFINGSDWQGILGLGYKKLTGTDTPVTPVFDTLVSNTNISDVFSMQLCGTLNRFNKDDREMGGKLVWGGVEPSLYSGQMFYTPIIKEQFYEIVIADILISGQSLNLDCKEYNFVRTIVDSGTTNINLPVRVFEKLINVLKTILELPFGISLDRFLLGQESVCWAEGDLHYQSFPNISLHLALSDNTVFNLTLSPQHYLQHVNAQMIAFMPLFEDCFVFAISASKTGSILGAVLMEAFYVVFDRENHQIGFALSTCRGRDPTKFLAEISGPYKFSGNTSDCAYSITEPSNTALSVIGYVTMAVVLVCVLPIVVLIVYWQIRTKCSKHKTEATDDTNLIER